MNPKLDASFFREITDQALIGLLLFTDDGTCQYMNHKASQIFEAAPDSTPMQLNQMVPEGTRNDKYTCFSVETTEHEGLFQNLIFKKCTGGNFIGSCGIRHLNLNNQKMKLLMIQDLTVQAKLQREIENKQNQIKLAYEELLLQNQQLKDLDVAKNRFIALVTHELRTPTSAVVATAEMLKLKLYDNEEQLHEFIGMIFDEGKLLLELINDILDFAKIQAGKMDYYIDEEDLVPLLEKSVESLQPIAEAANISLEIKSSPTKAVCYFDTVRLQQIIKNIISNGIKYNLPKGTVQVSAENREGIVRVHIKDTGKGISPENQKLIFNEFETLGKISSHTKGTGLGLPISKKMLEAMGGQIGFESEEGRGSHFWIDIPTTKILDNTEFYRKRAEDGIEDLAS